METVDGAPKDVMPSTMFEDKPNTLLLRINPKDLGELPQSVESQHSKYAARTEMHITIIGKPGAQIIQQKIDTGGLTREKYDEWSKTLDPKVVPTDKYMELQEKEVKDGQLITKRSIIQMVDIPGIRERLNELKEMLGMSGDEVFPFSPPHITLYTPESQASGIGLESPSDLENRNFDIDKGISARPVKIEGNQIIPLED